MPLNEFANLTEAERHRNFVRQLQIWRICPSGKCLRARSCRGDAKACFGKAAAWAQDVVREARIEFYRNDPQAQAEREELTRLVMNLAKTMKYEAKQKEQAVIPAEAGIQHKKA